MKKIAIILVCMMVCFSLFTGCTDQKNGGDQDTNVGNSVEFDVTDIDVDAETRPDAEDNSDSVSLPDGHGVQKIYKNTAPVFVGSGALCKVDSPFNCCGFVCSC